MHPPWVLRRRETLRIIMTQFSKIVKLRIPHLVFWAKCRGSVWEWQGVTRRIQENAMWKDSTADTEHTIYAACHCALISHDFSQAEMLQNWDACKQTLQIKPVFIGALPRQMILLYRPATTTHSTHGGHEFHAFALPLSLSTVSWMRTKRNLAGERRSPK